MDVNTLASMAAPARRDWYTRSLGPYERQLRQSALAHDVPVQLLATVVLNELADINSADLWQSALYVTKGSLGISQIQIDTVIRDRLFPDLTDAEGRAAFDEFVHSRPIGREWSAELLRNHENEQRLAINKRLQVPQHAVEAAAREIRILLDRMIAHRSSPWQLSQGFTHAGLHPALTAQAIYADVAGASQRDKEMNLGTLATGAYNSPGIIAAANASMTAFPNANIHGDNSRMISGDLYDFGLFRP
jgi:hypothetical protein